MIPGSCRVVIHVAFSPESMKNSGRFSDSVRPDKPSHSCLNSGVVEPGLF